MDVKLPVLSTCPVLTVCLFVIVYIDNIPM